MLIDAAADKLARVKFAGGLPSSLGGFNVPTDVVRRRFGRDSHRNAILGWASCAKELAFAVRNGVFALGKYPIWASSTPIWVFQFIPPESSALAYALFPKVRLRVLAVLFGTPVSPTGV